MFPLVNPFTLSAISTKRGASATISFEIPVSVAINGAIDVSGLTNVEY